MKKLSVAEDEGCEAAMKYIMKKLSASFVGMLLAAFTVVPAMADDIEIYTTLSAGSATIQPNLLFIMDTSGSMNSDVVTASVPYDPSITYPGSCDAGKIFYSSSGFTPTCRSSSYFNATANKCDYSLREHDAFGALTGNPGPLVTAGFFTGQVAQFTPAITTGPRRFRRAAQWDSLSNRSNAYDRSVECYMDRGTHGISAGSGDKYITNDPAAWTSSETIDPHAVWGNANNNYTLYHANYVNYLNDPTQIATSTRLEEMQAAVIGLTTANSSINIGLMRFDGGDQEGGPVMYPMEDVNAARGDFNSRVNNMRAGGGTPLAETYFEALRYYGGGQVYYGDAAVPSNQVGTTHRVGGVNFYDTAITDTCQKNYIIYLTDGEPTYDHLSTAQVNTMPGFTEGACADNGSGYTSRIADGCLEPFARWGKTNDIAFTANPAHDGEQTVTTYTIGFDLDPSLNAEAIQLLKDTAAAGGGSFNTATNAASLSIVFNKIIAEVLAVNSTFSSPAVSVNAFNRATNLDDLYFTLFKPTAGEHWEGNIKKFKLEFDANDLPFIADSNSRPAIDAVTGFFKDSSVSYWTAPADAPDGAETAKGGAASHVTRAGNKYTFAGTYNASAGVLVPVGGDLINSANELVSSNTNITDAMLGNVDALTPVDYYDNGVVVTAPYRDALIKWARGFDINDIDGDQNAIEDSRVMGDPLHAEPGLIQYGLTAGGAPDLVAYVATNDGYLHAVDTIDGSELFSFVPQEMLPKLQNIFEDTGLNGKAYGLDGNVVSWINDADRDGTVSGAGEHVYLYFGMRRGGRYIYSMDVTNRNAPQLRWVIEGGSGDYDELGQTWSAPNVEKIKIEGVDRTVLIFGAGYDTGQDLRVERGADRVGRGIFIVDADTGEMLWRAGPDGGADLQLTSMEYSIPARIKPIDTDGDGYTDRLFAGDMGGQLWRIDIDNDSNTASALAITGGRIAEFAVDNSTTDNRRFYNPPDVALILEEGQAPYLSIVAASGYRAHPLQTATHDRAYMVRDYNVYSVPATYTTLTEDDLFDTTANAIGEGTQAEIDTATASLNGAQGWYIEFNEMDGSFVGEKSLSEPLILGGVALFTTYLPPSAGYGNNSCMANDGTGTIYFVNVVDGTPTRDRSGDSNTTREDRKILLSRGGIPPTPRIIITDDGIPTLCIGTECTKSDEVFAIQKMYWYEVEE